jgi:hypothetical protein
MSIRTLSSVVLAAAIATSSLDARADETDLASYRERFKQGLDRYEQSDIAGALSFWEPLFRDLGPQKGYRVGYNLARAYEVLGDATRAAERYQSFLDEVAQREKDGFTLDDEVAGDRKQATTHLDDLARTRVRIRVAASTPPQSVRIDQSEPRLAGFTAYVASGAHDVVFAPGSSHEHAEHIDAQAGQVVDVAAPVVRAQTREGLSLLFREETRHPLWQGWLWIAGGVTLVAGGLTATAYVNATVLYNRSLPTPTSQQQSDYNGARTLAYASWAAPITAALVTTALVIWYVSGAKRVKIPVNTAFRF